MDSRLPHERRLFESGRDPPTQQTPGVGILVVDDNPHNLTAITAALGDIGEPLVTAQSGKEALRHLLRDDFALILLDVQMPAMDGFETARLIRTRERNRDLPIIFITGFDTAEADVLAAYELGAVDFLFKPIQPKVLRAKVSVFVALQRRTAEVVRQAALLREHEAREHDRRLAEEKRRWEQEALRQRLDEERKNAEESARRAEELARTIADRERAELELLHSNQRLEEADRSKDEFLAVLAHELRNPLTTLVTGMEILRRHSNVDDVVARVRDSADRQLRQLSRLVDDLLDVARITSVKIELRWEQVDLAGVVGEAVASCAAAIENRQQRLDASLPDQPLWVRGDSVRLTQIVRNLINNANRYTDAGGSIEVRCERDGDSAVLRVADNGRGIPPPLLERIFDMFVQRAPGEGLGLGLTLVNRLVTLHGGAVRAESDGEGCGSTFLVRLPAFHDMVVDEVNDAQAEHAAPDPADPVRLVLIEDDPDIRQTMLELLQMLGHSVTVATDGAEGLELLLRLRPDVALVDIGLPKLDGYRVAEQVRAAMPNDRPRLVAMSGHGRESDLARARAAGFEDYLIKPASFEQLEEVLHRT